MRHKRLLPAVALLTAGLVSAVAGAPSALAEGADEVINELEAQGYSVQINWTNGFDTKPLSSCTVTNVNNPYRDGSDPEPGDTVYVDVQCPNHADGDSAHFGVGLGVRLG